MILIFFRHGIALDKDEAIKKGVEESDRPLMKEGKEKTKKMAELLKKMSFEVGEVVSSPFLRALETAEIIKKTFALDSKILISESVLPERTFDDFLTLLKNKKEDSKPLIIVGHEPNLSHLVSRLLGGRKSFIELKKSGVAILEIESVSDAAAGNAVLHNLLSPKIL